MSDAYFVTGTDTGVGKTLVAAALLFAAQARGWRTLGLKPLASGSTWQGGLLRNDDALALQAAMTEPLPYEAINPFAFEPPVAPHVAAAEAGIVLEAAALAAHCRAVLSGKHQFAVIEGAGGWRVPLGPRETLADLAIVLGLPVVLVVGVRLGCINHALLTAEAIRRDGLRLAGWIANQIEPPMPRCEETIDTLRQWLGAPCVGVVPFSSGIEPYQIADLLDISLLTGR